MDLLGTYTHDSEEEVITAPQLIFTILQIATTSDTHFLACSVFTRRSLATAFNSWRFFSFPRSGRLSFITAYQLFPQLTWIVIFF
jgi:hypothetical protein